MESANTGNGRSFAAALDESRHAREEIDRLAEALRRARGEWESVLREHVVDQPYTALAVAAGVGFILGGGLAPGLVRTLLGTGTRMGLGLALERLFTNPAAGAFQTSDFAGNTE
jgi:hypothetical protein